MSYHSIYYLLLINFLLSGKISSQNLGQYNVVWNSQSQNSSESMPLVGHSVGCNVWVEHGDIYFYAAQSGAFDENNEALKAGRFRLRLSPNPFKGKGSFRQELRLKEGYIEISSQHPEQGQSRIRIWIEAKEPIIHVDVLTDKKLGMEVSYESWRFDDRILKTEKAPGVKGRRASIFDYDNYQMDLVKYGDRFQVEGDNFYFFHNNEHHLNAFNFAVEQENLNEVRSEMVDPLQNLISGGLLYGDDLIFSGNTTGEYANTPFRSWIFSAEKPSKEHHFQVFLKVEQEKDVMKWKRDLLSLEQRKKSREDLFDDTSIWWKKFWNKSYIIINPEKKDTDDAPWRVGRNYNLFRYQLGGNTYGKMPTKFNGGNLTFDPVNVDQHYAYDPDFRRWGGGTFTAQNQRLVYWPMLKSGDFQQMLPQFKFYMNALENAIARTKAYWGHGGSSFTEQMQESGLPVVSHYGFQDHGFWNTQRPLNYEKGLQVNPYVQTLFQGQLEFSFMILEYYRYSGEDISQFLPFIYNAVYFYDHHYRYVHRKETGKELDEEGNLVLYPTTPGEHSPNSTNASDAVAGFRAVVETAVNLPDKVMPDSIRTYFKSVKERIPPLELYSYKASKGKSYTLLRESKEDTIWHSGFMPSLYAVYPYHLITSESKEFPYAINVWNFKMSDENKFNYASWRPGAFMGANLGLNEYTKNQILKKLGDSKRRYPTFWGPGHDWVPDHNWGGSGMIALQDMLLQEKGGKIHLFPVWPTEWNVQFKLHASGKTTIEGELWNGKVRNLKVTPDDRKKDVVIDLE